MLTNVVETSDVLESVTTCTMEVSESAEPGVDTHCQCH